VLSRHNIRAPLSTTGSALDKATPHTWIDWTSNASELSMRGGTLETMMGEYMRKWLESEELIPENYRPEAGKVRFYANAKQRTIATAQYFSSGMLPVADVDIETHADYDKMDPVFTPATTFVSDSYVDAALKSLELCSYSIQIGLLFRCRLTFNNHLVEYGVDELNIETVSSSAIGVTDDTQGEFLCLGQLELEHIICVASRVQDEYLSSVAIEEELCCRILIRPRASPTSLVESHHTTLTSNAPIIGTGIKSSGQCGDVVPITRCLTLPLNLQGAIGCSGLV
jgi:hypothetical protein